MADDFDANGANNGDQTTTSTHVTGGSPRDSRILRFGERTGQNGQQGTEEDHTNGNHSFSNGYMDNTHNRSRGGKTSETLQGTRDDLMEPPSPPNLGM